MKIEIDNTFHWPVRVYWEDTDAGGVVYHANYLCFLERCRTEWLRSVGVHQTELRQQDNALLVVLSLNCDYVRSARLDDELLVTAAVSDVSRASFTFSQTIECEGKLLIRASVKAACLWADSWKPRRFPASLAERLASLV